MSDSIQERIYKIITNYDYDKKTIINPDTDLFIAGVIDSLRMIEYIIGIESEFNIKLSNDDLVPQNLWSIEATANTVKRYLQT